MTFQGAIQAHGNPAGWPEVELRSVVRQRKEFEQPDLPLLGVSVASGVRPRTTDDGRQAASLDLSAYKVVHPGDVIMNALGKPHGSIGVSTTAGITSPAYWVLEVSGEVPRFVHYMLRSQHMVNEYQRLGKYLPPNQFDIPWETFRSVAIPLPGLDEQRRIADFLDDQVSFLNRVMDSRERQRILVQERLVANYDALFVGPPRPLKQVLRQSPSYGVLVPRFVDDGGVRFIRIGNLNHLEEPDLMLNQIDAAQSLEYRRTLVKPGDVLVGVVGSIDKSALVPEDLRGANLARAVARLVPTDELPAELLLAWTKTSYYGVLARQATANDTAQPTLNMGDLKNFPIALRTDCKVSELLEKARRAKTSHGELVSALENSLALLQERKRALITAAVTGEFDVSTASGRNVA